MSVLHGVSCTRELGPTFGTFLYAVSTLHGNVELKELEKDPFNAYFMAKK
ncbi:hypothetical protein [Arthrobacter sp. ISL-72]|nr:hypothetical protein [Arthrobacter sp. ISL-72]MBT2597148.1 hypothetical protein [Arthrobacter sp. ISL-72]